MPVYRSHTVLEAARRVKALLELNASLIRGTASDLVREPERLRQKLKRARMKLSRSQRQLEQLQERLADKDRQLARLWEKPSEAAAEAGKVKPENVVWIFGFGRSGSTWLASMMSDLKDHTLWHEPLIGMLFGNFYYNVSYYGIEVGEVLHKNQWFILGSRRDIWLGLIRSFFLDGASAMFPAVGDGTLVVKEPNGSVGAPLLMDALPESRMILLIRDPRDAMASAVDAYGEGGWAPKVLGREDVTGINVETWLDWYQQSIDNARRAFDAHKGRKVLVRYEDLRVDTLAEMKRIYSTLGIAVDDEELATVVEKHAWENIPEEKKGEGKFYRKAKPGSWKSDLSRQQVEIVERITAPLLKEFYS